MRSRQLTRLAVRFLLADWQRNLVFAVWLGSAVLCALLLAGAGQDVRDRIDSESRDRHGVARISIPAARDLAADFQGGHTLVGAGAWITRDQELRMAELLRPESAALSAAIECDAILVRGADSTPMQITSRARPPASDGAVDPRTLESGRPDGERPGDSEERPTVQLLVGYLVTSPGADAAVEFVDLQDLGVGWNADAATPGVIYADHNALLTALRERGLAPGNGAGTILTIEAPRDLSPSVVAYNARELLISEFPAVQVVSMYDLAGRAAQVSAENIPALLTLAVLLPAIAALVGLVLVTAESRSEEFTLLSTLGFGVPLLRKLIVREILMASTVAVVCGALLYALVAALVPAVQFLSGPVLVYVLAGTIAPAGLAALVARRALSGTVAERLAEFRR